MQKASNNFFKSYPRLYLTVIEF